MQEEGPVAVEKEVVGKEVGILEAGKGTARVVVVGWEDLVGGWEDWEDFLAAWVGPAMKTAQ